MELSFTPPAKQVEVLDQGEMAFYIKNAVKYGVESAVKLAAERHGFPAPDVILEKGPGVSWTRTTNGRWAIEVHAPRWKGAISAAYHELIHVWQLWHIARALGMNEEHHAFLRATWPAIVEQAIEGQGLLDKEMVQGWYDCFSKEVEQYDSFPEGDIHYYRLAAVYYNQPNEADAYWAQMHIEDVLKNETNPPYWWE